MLGEVAMVGVAPLPWQRIKHCAHCSREQVTERFLSSGCARAAKPAERNPSERNPIGFLRQLSNSPATSAAAALAIHARNVYSFNTS